MIGYFYPTQIGDFRPARNGQFRPALTLIQKNLINALHNNHMTRRKLAELLGVATNTISNWTSGHNIPSIDKKTIN